MVNAGSSTTSNLTSLHTVGNCTVSGALTLTGALDVDLKTQRPYYGGEWVDWKWSTSRFLLDELKEEEQKGQGRGGKGGVRG